jgi:hypothetical protein
VLSRIAIAHPALGSHLNESVLLGVRCSYQPNEPIGGTSAGLLSDGESLTAEAMAGARLSVAGGGGPGHVRSRVSSLVDQ